MRSSSSPDKKVEVFVVGVITTKILEEDHSSSKFIPLSLQDLDGTIIDIQGTDNDVYILTSTGKLYSSCSFSKLHKVANYQLYLVESLVNVCIEAMYCGGLFVHVKSRTGQLYTMGDNATYQLGLSCAPDAASEKFLPLDMSMFDDMTHYSADDDCYQQGCRSIIELVSSTDRTAFYLAKNRRELFASGALVNSTVTEPIRPVLPSSVVSELQAQPELHIKQISSGSNHTLVLFSNNRIMGFGRNDHSQLGYTSSGELGQWISYDFESPIRYLYAGSFHSFFLTENSTFSCGYSGDGRLGHSGSNIGPITCFTTDPTTRKSSFFVEDIIGRASTMFVVRDKENKRRLFSIGSNHYGEAGIGSTGSLSSVVETKDPHICSLINDPSYTMKHACGYYFRFLYFTENAMQDPLFFKRLYAAVPKQQYTDISISCSSHHLPDEYYY